MKKSLILGILLPVLLFAGNANEEFRATWTITWHQYWSGATVDQLKARTREIIDNHKKANMNAVLWHVRQGGTCYYPSQYEPWGSYIGSSDPGYDPLAYAIEYAHSQGLELHAWFNTFQTSSTASGTVAAEHPDWICRDADGNPMTASRCVSPGLEAVRDYTRDLVMEIVNNYDVDGIHFDYVRWNEYSSSKGSQDLAELAEKEDRMDGQWSDREINVLMSSKASRYIWDSQHTSGSAIPDSSELFGHGGAFPSWDDWRRACVTAFVEAVHDSIQQVKPWVRVSAAALGKYNWSTWQGYGSVFQDAALWFNEGVVDQLTPMHYHWTDANGFVQALSTGGTESWQHWIGKGIANGTLFSAGPGSYILSDNNVWYRHPSIVNAIRGIDWVDGFQFFSYGSWKDHSYWEEAGQTFFGNKAKIRPNPVGKGLVSPDTPLLQLTKNSEYSYTLSVDPAPVKGSGQWYIIYRSGSENFDPDSSAIEDIVFSDGSASYQKDFSPYGTLAGRQYFAVSAADRFWNESGLSTPVVTDSLQTLPASLTCSETGAGLVKVNAIIGFEFDKSMDQASFENAFSITPLPASVKFSWDKATWLDGRKKVSVSFPDMLEHSTDYSITVPGTVVDESGMALDGDGDGVAGGDFQLSFRTDDMDTEGPVLLSSVFNTPFQPFDVVSCRFDESIDPASIPQDVSLEGPGTHASLYVSVNGNEVNFVPRSMLLPDTQYTLNFTSVADTVGNTSLLTDPVVLQTSPEFLAQKKLIDNFSSKTGWWAPTGSGGWVGVDGTSSFGFSSNSVPGEESVAGQLNYIWDAAVTTGNWLREHCASPVDQVTFDTTWTLQAYVYGDGSGNDFRFSLYETGGQIAEVSNWVAMDWSGWKLLEWKLSDPNTIGVWDGIGNGAMDGSSYKMEGIHVRRQNFTLESSTIYIDQLQVVKKSTGVLPANLPPVVDALPDTSALTGKRLSIYVYYTDENAGDIHLLTATSDTSDILISKYGDVSGSRFTLKAVNDYAGTSLITVVVKDFGVGELADTVKFYFTAEPVSAVSEMIPEKFSLSQNYPNPFNPVTTIRYDLDKPGLVKMDIYDIQGRHVMTALNREMQAGSYSLNLNMSGYSSGVYFCRLVSGRHSAVIRFVLMK